MNDLDLCLEVVSRSRDPQRYCKAVRSAILATAWLLVICDNVIEKNYTVGHKKTCHYILDYNFHISWCISTLCVPTEKGI